MSAAKLVTMRGAIEISGSMSTWRGKSVLLVWCYLTPHKNITRQKHKNNSFDLTSAFVFLLLTDKSKQTGRTQLQRKQVSCHWHKQPKENSKQQQKLTLDKPNYNFIGYLGSNLHDSENPYHQHYNEILTIHHTNSDSFFSEYSIFFYNRYF